MNDDAPTQNALQNMIAQAQNANGGSDGLPPVHLWEPDYCGDIGLHIARDGQWYYAGSPIGESGWCGYFPRFCVMMMAGCLFGDAGRKNSRGSGRRPLCCHTDASNGQWARPSVEVETNVHDFATAGAEHALRIELVSRQSRVALYSHSRAP